MSDPRQLKIDPDTVEGHTLTQKLGQGSTGTVFKAKSIATGDAFAIKLIFPHIASKPGFNDVFVRVAQHSARVDHPNIVRTHSSGVSNGYHFVVMEYVEGKTLEAVLGRGAMDETRCLQITLAIAKALEHARTLGIVHRDVKPANILLPRGADAKLADLGLAIMATNPAVPGGVTGTPAYLPPEAARCEAGIDSRADVYSLGATLHHMLTGQPMFSGSVAEVVSAHLTEKPKPPARVNTGVSAQASKLVEKLTEKKVADRPQPAEVVALVEAILRGEKPLDVSVPRKGGSPEERAAKDAPTSLMAPPILTLPTDRATTPYEETISAPRSPAAHSPGSSPPRHAHPSPYPPAPPVPVPPPYAPQYPPPGGYPPQYPAAPAQPGRAPAGYPSPYPPAPPWQPGAPMYPPPWPPAGSPPSPYPPAGAPPPPWPPAGSPPPPYPTAGTPPPPPPPGPGAKPPGGKMAKRRKPGRRWGDLI